MTGEEWWRMPDNGKRPDEARAMACHTTGVVTTAQAEYRRHGGRREVLIQDFLMGGERCPLLRTLTDNESEGFLTIFFAP
jgi:hypothetical protein